MVVQSCGGAKLCGVYHMASVAKEINIERVVNHFIPLATECGTQGLM